MIAIEVGALAVIAGGTGGTSTTKLELGVQVGPWRLGGAITRSQSDRDACLDYVREHRQPASACADIK